MPDADRYRAGPGQLRRVSVWTCSALASVSRSKASRIELDPTGASLLTASVPRKSRSPSAVTVPLVTSICSEVATARSVTHVLGKLGAANRTEAAARARQLGLIP